MSLTVSKMLKSILKEKKTNFFFKLLGKDGERYMKKLKNIYKRRVYTMHVIISEQYVYLVNQLNLNTLIKELQKCFIY